MKNEMKISIITVSYNSAETISDTLRSVEQQTYQNFEHLIIDGNSKDLTNQIIEKYKHPRLFVISEQDEGIYDAMNKGLVKASGEVIGFLNSDDFYSEPIVLEKISAAFKDDSVEACFADLDYVTKDAKNVSRKWKSKAFKPGDFAKGWCPAHPTFYIRRSALERMGLFDRTFKLASDVEFMMRYLECGSVKSTYIPHVLVRMRIGGVTNKNWINIVNQNKEIFLALKKNAISFNPFVFFWHKIYSRALQLISARISRNKIFK